MAIKAMGWAHSFPVSGGVRAGRSWTRRQLESLPWTAAEPETVDAVVLAVSELLTNAHVHAHSDACLILTWDGDCLHVSVHDEDPTLPRRRDPQMGETSGRGVGIVRMLADEMQMTCQRHGKTVMACFRPAGAARRGGS
ncbi:ATP-binding protein [Streptomyces turgidiscabies]|uniref:Anti-sigma regulatory factor (Ser/Thr protein kinase) n=1 Tax=Streptomyces turgidiscabies TaxID=85558 RepID=A0ABU0RV53_9ACTN|nr:ATP-binding protein [Streptomyces turgidiscabies]MDQ0935836.1 anti-sigma regulatory factor (Ser/Thr protein kinase) [Streptomyces turgidiscabies]